MDLTKAISNNVGLFFLPRLGGMLQTSTLNLSKSKCVQTTFPVAVTMRK
jgi:hypothetical protein